MALAKMRSIEHRRFLVRSTNSGISGFVDPVGRLLQQTPTFEEAAIAEDDNTTNNLVLDLAIPTRHLSRPTGGNPTSES